MSNQEAVDILRRVSDKSIEWRLAYGQELRNQMYEVLDRQGTPNSYRFDWISKCSKDAIIPLLSKLSIQFNADHPNDRASVEDMLDVLNTAVYLLNQKLGGTKS